MATKLIKLLNLSETAVLMLKALLILFFICLAVGLGIIFLLYAFERPIQYGLGLLLGILLSATKVVLMERTLNKSLEMESGNAKNYAGLHIMLRYLLTIAVFAVIILWREIFGLFGAIVGVLCLQGSAYMTGHWIKKMDKQN